MTDQPKSTDDFVVLGGRRGEDGSGIRACYLDEQLSRKVCWWFYLLVCSEELLALPGAMLQVIPSLTRMRARITERQPVERLHPHDWDFRKPKSQRFKSRSSYAHLNVPAPSIFRDVVIPYSLTRNSTAPPTFEQYPAPGHVASHLLLIECFQKLRSDIETSSSFRNAVQHMSHDGFSKTTKQSSWSAYLTIAIQRFRLWITRIESVIRHSAVFNRYGTGSHLHGAFTEDYLPPIDVLLIWYCYLQNPAAYERLLASNTFQLLGQISFPWHVFPHAINKDTLKIRSTSAAEALWKMLLGISTDLQDCIGMDLGSGTAAFTSHADETLELAITQSEILEKIDQNKWLRSPSLRGTIQRAMRRYTEQILPTNDQLFELENTQRVPTAIAEPRDLKEIQFDTVTLLVLQTHRAYHAAWQSFATRYNLNHDERPPPPPYYTEDGATDSIEQHGLGRSISQSLEADCYCWICERIKDETETEDEPAANILLTQVSSPEPADDKRSVVSMSSSDTDNSTPTLGLSKKQIRDIKADVWLYRLVEENRQRQQAQ